MTQAPGGTDLFDFIAQLMNRVSVLERQVAVQDTSQVSGLTDMAVTPTQATIYTGPSSPTGLNQSTDVGTTYIDNAGVSSWWTGLGWQSGTYPYAQVGFTNLAAVVPGAVAAGRTSITTYSQAGAPTASGTFDCWFNTGTSVWSMWIGSSWVAITDTVLITALNALNPKATVIAFTLTAPTGGAGRLWYSRNENMIERYWDGTGWVATTNKTVVVAPTTNTLPPSYSPVPTALGSIGTILLTWQAVPNAESVTYAVHMSTTNNFTPGSTTLLGTTASTSFTARALPDGTALAYGTTYYFKLVASDIDGAATASAQASASLVKINNPDVSANYVYVGQIIADQIMSGNLEAVVAILGSLNIGNISIDPANGIMITLTDGGLIQFPASGDPAVITAVLDAYQLLVRDNATIQGLNNVLGGTLTAQTVPLAPTTKPGLLNVATLNANSITVTGLPVNDATYSYSPFGLEDGGAAGWYLLVNKTGRFDSTTVELQVYAVNKTTGAATLVKTIAGAVFPMDSSKHGPVLIGTDLWIAWHDFDTGINTYRAYSTSTWAQTDSFTDSGADWGDVIGTDGISLLIWNTSGTTFRTVSPSTHAIVNTYNVVGITSGDLSYINGYFIGKRSFDYGATRFVIGGYSRAFVYDGSGARVAAEAFQIDSTGYRAGYTYDGSAWYDLMTSGSTVKIRKLGGTTIATSRSVTWTRYDNVPTTHETKPSPAATLTQNARAYLRVSTDQPGNSGGTDDPNAVGIYIANHLQAYLATGVTVAYYDVPTTGGAAAPTTEGFLGSTGTIGTFQSDTAGSFLTKMWALKGDGGIRLDGINPPFHQQLLKDATQSIATGIVTPTAVTWPTSVFTTAGMFPAQGSSGAYTFTKAGVYLISFNMEFAANATGARYAGIYISGVRNRMFAEGQNGASDPAHVQGTLVVRVSAGDYWQLMVMQNSGGNLNIGDTVRRSFIDITRMGDLT